MEGRDESFGEAKEGVRRLVLSEAEEAEVLQQRQDGSCSLVVEVEEEQVRGSELGEEFVIL